MMDKKIGIVFVGLVLILSIALSADYIATVTLPAVPVSCPAGTTATPGGTACVAPSGESVVYYTKLINAKIVENKLNNSVVKPTQPTNPDGTPSDVVDTTGLKVNPNTRKVMRFENIAETTGIKTVLVGMYNNEKIEFKLDSSEGWHLKKINFTILKAGSALCRVDVEESSGIREWWASTVDFFSDSDEAKEICTYSLGSVENTSVGLKVKDDVGTLHIQSPLIADKYNNKPYNTGTNAWE